MVIGDSAHAEGSGKAGFFTSRGFSREEWEVLARSLREIAVSGAVVESLSKLSERRTRDPTPAGTYPFQTAFRDVACALSRPCSPCQR